MYTRSGLFAVVIFTGGQTLSHTVPSFAFHELSIIKSQQIYSAPGTYVYIL